jgi:glycosyltransferase involved in cell wall biosynthesis
VTKQRPRVLFLYLGRRGALARLALDVAVALPRMTEVDGRVLVAASNELIDKLLAAGPHVEAVVTFDHGLGVLRFDRLLVVRKRLTQIIRDQQIDAVVVLMSHAWTPILAGAVRKAGARYVVVVHDADAHPGDSTARMLAWLLRDIGPADRIIALTRHVADRLVARRLAPPEKIAIVSLPVLGYEAGPVPQASADRPFGFLFFGRIARYKGLDLLVAAAEILRSRGVQFRLGVAGEGDLAALRSRLVALGAEIDNRWIDDAEVGVIISRYDAVVLSYIEASQSGVIAAAFSCGLPVVATPIGGLREQIVQAETGLLAVDVSPEALADAMERMAGDRSLYGRLREGVVRAREAVSTQRFTQELVEEAVRESNEAAYRH